MRWKDDEGDWIMLSSEDDMKEAFTIAETMGDRFEILLTPIDMGDFVMIESPDDFVAVHPPSYDEALPKDNSNILEATQEGPTPPPITLAIPKEKKDVTVAATE